MSIIDEFRKPIQTYKNRVKQEKELLKRDPIDMRKINEDQRVLLVERDLNEILEKYIDSQEASSLDVVFPKDYGVIAEQYLKEQHINFTRLSDTRINIKEQL